VNVSIWETAVGQSIEITIEYYNQKHEAALKKYPTADRIQKLVDSGLSVKVPEFLTYFLFHRVRMAPSRYGSYAAVRSTISDAYGMLADFVALENGAFYVSNGTDSLTPHLTEYIGDSTALSVMNAVHGLTEADWLPIPVRPGKQGVKTLDYEYGSNGKRVIQVEAKGTVVEDAQVRSSSISQHKANIEKKKAANPPVDELTLPYGVIAAVSKSPQNLRCLLLDPVPSDHERSPRDLQIFARLRFLWWIVWFVSPRSLLATALSTRSAAVESILNPFELDGVPLGRPDGKPFTIEYADGRGYGHVVFFNSRSRISDGPAGGVVFPLNNDQFLFFGFQTRLLELSAAQEFREILEYTAEVGSAIKQVFCVVPAGEFYRFGIDEARLPRFSRGGGYVRFELSGRLSYTKEGLVFGVLPICA
jgi:hypothetical protein